MPMISKKAHIMQTLSITEEQLLKDKAKVVEKCFCAALLSQDPKVTNEVLKGFLNLMDGLYLNQEYIRCTKVGPSLINGLPCSFAIAGDGFTGCNVKEGTCTFQTVMSYKE
jgi:hypothetical protein